MNDPGILVVIVVYSTGYESSASFLSLTRAAKAFGKKLDLVIYDNKPGEHNSKPGLYDSWNITYVADEANSGVSKAYNEAAKIGLINGKTRLLLADEDTHFPENTFLTYAAAISGHPAEKLFAPVMLTGDDRVISPCIFRFQRGFYGPPVSPGFYDLTNRSLINCGLCIDLKTFETLGGYNEGIKLDFSDHEFIHRFKSVVANQCFIIDLKIKHNLSTAAHNSPAADLKRFDYYLDGAAGFSRTANAKILVNLHTLVRSVKLSVLHRDSLFFKRAIKRIFE
jgi:rhamnosyltransferase